MLLLYVTSENNTTSAKNEAHKCSDMRKIDLLFMFLCPVVMILADVNEALLV